MDIREIYKNFLDLENKQKVTECGDMGAEAPTSINISMSGQNASEVEQLMQLFKNAGMEAPKMDMPAKIGGPGNAPCPVCGKVHVGAGQGCMGEEEVEEAEWDNAPDEEYKDDDYMVRDMGDDLHRKKDRRAIRTAHPSLEEIEESLWAALKEKKSPAGGPACWPGKKIHPTKPTKMKGGKKVNNCIDADSSDGK